MITHEEARHLIGKTDYLNSHLLADYITQQEKVTKLLELYKKLNETPTTAKYLRKQIVSEILVLEEKLK